MTCEEVKNYHLKTKVGKTFILLPLDFFFFSGFSSPLALDINILKPSRFREISSTALSYGLYVRITSITLNFGSILRIPQIF